MPACRNAYPLLGRPAPSRSEELPMHSEHAAPARQAAALSRIRWCQSIIIFSCTVSTDKAPAHRFLTTERAERPLVKVTPLRSKLCQILNSQNALWHGSRKNRDWPPSVVTL